MDLTITELAVPTAPRAAGWDELLTYVGLIRDNQLEHLGATDLAPRPEAMLAYLQAQTYQRKRVWLAQRGEQVVGFASYERSRDASDPVAGIAVAVVPDHRRRGIGRQLLDITLAACREDGASLVHAGSEHQDLSTPPRLAPSTGVGDVPADAASVRFLTGVGFTLEQVEVSSALPLPVPVERLDALAAELRPALAYDLISWADDVPDELIEEFARLRTVMSTAAPSGGLTEVEQVWDADRVRDRDQRNRAMGQRGLTTAARELATGRLVAFTTLALDADPETALGQGYTLVLPEHRGHNLGMRIKIENLRRLAEVETRATRLVTGNAGENDAMLSINRALGFRPAWLNGWWERAVDAPR